MLLAAAACAPVRHGSVPAALNALVPPDTVGLICVRIDRLRAVPLYAKLAAENRQHGFGPFGAGAGTDIDRDIDTLLLASDGKNILAIAQGRFAPDFPNRFGSGNDLVAALIAKDIAIAGNAATVRAAVEQSKRGGGGAPRALLDRADALASGAQIWAVMAGWHGIAPDQLGQLGNMANFDRLMRLVESASLTIDLHSGVHANVTGECRSEQNATDLANSLRALDSLARMAIPRSQPDLPRALEAIQIRQAGRSVQVTADLSEDLAEKLIR